MGQFLGVRGRRVGKTLPVRGKLLEPLRCQGDGWRPVAGLVRSLTDLGRYVDPRYADAPALRARMAGKLTEHVRTARAVDPVTAWLTLRAARFSRDNVAEQLTREEQLAWEGLRLAFDRYQSARRRHEIAGKNYRLAGARHRDGALSSNRLLEIETALSESEAALAGAERVFELLDTEPDLVDAPDAVELPPIVGRVLFDDVSFAYNPEEPVLEGVGLVAEPGATVALVGATGAGKTTLVNLLGRFYDATGGSVTIDGYDVRQVTRASLHHVYLKEPSGCAIDTAFDKIHTQGIDGAVNLGKHEEAKRAEALGRQFPSDPKDWSAGREEKFDVPEYYLAGEKLKIYVWRDSDTAESSLAKLEDTFLLTSPAFEEE